MSNNDWAQPPRLTEAPPEYLVSVELYVSTTAAAALRKPPVQRKKTEKRDTTKQSSSVPEDRKVKEKGSWINLARNSTIAGHWRPAVCKVSEEGERCLLNIYVDEAILYQTVYIHLLNHTDIRQADRSLFSRRDCLGIYCAAGQRWTSTSSTHTAEPLYIQFASSDVFNSWLVLLRSYAIPEIYGRWFFPADGGLYRIWRQVELTVIQGRNLGSTKHTLDPPSHRDSFGELDSRSEPDAVDLDVSCDINVNDILCGRTTVKKGIGSPDWHESFIFSDLPPFEMLDIHVWREKKLFKPSMIGSVRVALGNFRRGESVEGWFPVLQTGSIANGIQVGDIRMKIRVDEEIILPKSAYAGLLRSLNSRNFLHWMKDFESKLQLKTVSNSLISIAIARNVLIDHIFDIADGEVDGTPHSHNTLFRGNTILTKTMELCMAWYGKSFLEASIGSAIRRLCAEKVAIEVDPIRSGKNSKDVERNVDLLIYWCREFWGKIYAVRGECPHEMRRLFEHIRKLVERHYEIRDTDQDQNRELPWQSVSAFCFLRFIVPGILHPHLFGLCPGLPSVAVHRSLTLIAKVIQSLANLNTSVQKEEFMRGVKDFIRDSRSAMIDYLLVVSTPVSEPSGSYPGTADRHDRSAIATFLHQRRSSMSMLDQEAIPLLPHVLDIPRQLAIISSAVIRNTKSYHQRSKSRELGDEQLEEFCNRCFEIEEQAVNRVSQLAARASERRQSASGSSFSPSPTAPIPGPSRSRKASTNTSYAGHKHILRRVSRPSTAPSGSDASDIPPRDMVSDMSSPSSPVSSGLGGPLLDQTSQFEIRGGQLPSSPEGGPSGTWSHRKHRPLQQRSTSADSIPSNGTSAEETSVAITRSVDLSVEAPDEVNKKKKGLLRGILTKR